MFISINVPRRTTNQTSPTTNQPYTNYNVPCGTIGVDNTGIALKDINNLFVPRRT